jgi:hypothetical protein
MDHGAAPTAGEADAGRGSGAAPDTLQRAERDRAERDTVVSSDAGRAASAAPVRRPRTRQAQRTGGAIGPQLAADSIRRAAAARRPASDAAVPTTPVREPSAAPPPTETLTAQERESIERELRVRRARLDSLARRLDSLRPPPPEAPPPAP